MLRQKIQRIREAENPARLTPLVRVSAQNLAGWLRPRPKTLLFCWFPGRNFRVARRGFFQVGFGAGICVVNRPADSSGEQVQEKLVLPLFRAVAEGGVKDTSLAMH